MRYARALAAAAASIVIHDYSGAWGRPPEPRRWGREQSRTGYRTINRLNRSQRWLRASSYAHARALSPVPERPVR